jgi:acetyltransferase (GNAT) family protein
MESADDSAEPRGAGTRRTGLPDGRTLVVRAVTPGDVGGLAQLYAGLSVDDVYRRFFSVYHPDRRFFDRVATSADRGGFGLVAVVGERIVGEAGYELLQNGDGELAIAVAGEWRGWLGPYLLDALVEAAGARGVAHLEADILVTNAGMLSLIRSRGYATAANDDWATVRVLISTSGRVPSWPGAHTRPRILVEVPGARWHAGMAGEAAGMQILACPGPLGSHTRCPALAGKPCPLAVGADAVVVSHVADDERWDALVAAHSQVHPGVPVCVEVPRDAEPPSEDSSVAQVSADEGDEAVVAFVDGLARLAMRRS